jgi:hypothetical protein
MLPFYLLQARGKLDISLNPVDVTALLELPELAKQNVNMH